MQENNHECILGLLNDNGIEELATLSILKRRIQNTKEFNDSIRSDLTLTMMSLQKDFVIKNILWLIMQIKEKALI